MRKIVLFLVVLCLMAVPAMAAPTVTMTCTVSDTNLVTVAYAVTGSTHLVRAFGLDIKVTTNDANITTVTPLNTNYRIYPGQIVITDGEVTNYGTPYAAADLRDKQVTVEMGSLYTIDPCYASDANAGYNKIPALSGNLLSFRVDKRPCTVAVDVNALRGGVVMEDPAEVLAAYVPASCVVPGAIELIDCGDAPNTYATLLANAGPSHVAVGPMLGATRDTELDGQPSANCTLDDTTTSDDEDGITNLIATSMIAGSVTVNASATCLLNAWIDFNNDGDFADAGEQILTNSALVAGNNNKVFAIPAGAVRDTQLVSRWRVNTAGGLSYSGPAVDGEVEDYKGLNVVCMMEATTPAATRTAWVLWNKPRCWCYERNCRADTDGNKTGSSWIAAADLNLIKSCYLKADTILKNIVLGGVPGICADADKIKTGASRVAAADLNTIKSYYLKPITSVPPCAISPNYYFWCTPPTTCPLNF